MKTHHIRIGPNVITQAVNDETILLNTTTESFISLNNVGAVIWESLKSNGEVADAVEAVHQAFDTGGSTEVVQNDVNTFIAQLIELGVASPSL